MPLAEESEGFQQRAQRRGARAWKFARMCAEIDPGKSGNPALLINEENILKSPVENAASTGTSESFKHVIITRYFTRHSNDPNEFELKLGNSLEWLENRLVLFKRYCFPSIIAQSDQNFTWLLFFDENTPPDYLRRMRELIAGHDNIKICLSSPFTKEALTAAVRAELDPDTKWVVTSRLDNDDGYHRDFVKNLHAQLHYEREFLNFPTGIIYYRGRTYLYRHRSNAFVSFCEPSADFLTVLCIEHVLVNQVAPVRQLNGPPAFMQAVHGGNVSNKPRGIRVHRMLAMNGFEPMTELFVDPAEESDAEILFENLTVATGWMIRDRMIGLARTLKSRTLQSRTIKSKAS